MNETFTHTRPAFSLQNPILPGSKAPPPEGKREKQGGRRLSWGRSCVSFTVIATSVTWTQGIWRESTAPPAGLRGLNTSESYNGTTALRHWRQQQLQLTLSWRPQASVGAQYPLRLQLLQSGVETFSFSFPWQNFFVIQPVLIYLYLRLLHVEHVFRFLLGGHGFELNLLHLSDWHKVQPHSKITVTCLSYLCHEKLVDGLVKLLLWLVWTKRNISSNSESSFWQIIPGYY